MTPREKQPIADRVYSQLKTMILYHKLSPGQRLQDRDLAGMLDVSRTPVREALSRLERDGLVVKRNGKGHFVRRIDPEEVAHLYDVRELLETQATCLAAKHATPQALASLAKMLARLERLGDSPDERAEGISLGIEFHVRIARASGNPVLSELLARLLDQQLFYIWTEGWHESPAEQELTKRDHRAYLVALQERSLPQARAIVRAHVRRFKSRLLEILRAREAYYLGMEERRWARG